MPRPSFDVARLRAFVAEKVGEPVDRFTQLTDCSNASNFAAVTAGGRRLLVKCTAAPRAGRNGPMRESGDVPCAIKALTSCEI